jgi:hypothetical protein
MISYGFADPAFEPKSAGQRRLFLSWKILIVVCQSADFFNVCVAIWALFEFIT